MWNIGIHSARRRERAELVFQLPVLQRVALAQSGAGPGGRAHAGRRARQLRRPPFRAPLRRTHLRGHSQRMPNTIFHCYNSLNQ